MRPWVSLVPLPLLLPFCASTLLLPAPVAALSAERRIKQDLFISYDKMLRPVRDDKDIVNVTLNPQLLAILDTNEAEESITIVEILEMSWKDAALTWDPQDYNNKKTIKVPISELWQPDLQIFPTLSLVRQIEEERNYANIEHDGEVSVQFIQKRALQCLFHVADFPFDVQACKAIFGSWMYAGKEVNVRALNQNISMLWFSQNQEWFVDSLTAVSRNLQWNDSFGEVQTVSDVVVTMTIRRKPFSYLLSLVIPSYVITSVAIVGLFTPSTSSGERSQRVGLGLTTLLAMCLILNLATEEMPKSSDSVSAITVYLWTEIAVICFCIGVSVCVMHFHVNGITRRLSIPRWLLNLTLLCKSRKGRERILNESIYLRTFTTTCPDLAEPLMIPERNCISSHRHSVSTPHRLSLSRDNPLASQLSP